MSQKEKTLSDFPEYVRINDKVQALRAQKQKAIDRIAEIDAEQSKPKHQATGQEAWKRALEDNYRFEVDVDASLREERGLVEGNLRSIDEALSVLGKWPWPKNLANAVS